MPADLNNCCVQKLLLQALRGHKKVEQGNLDRNLRGVVGVGQLTGHIEAEIGMVGHHIVTNLDDFAASL